MSTVDLLRFGTDFRKHFSGVRMQQGRCFTEDDQNEMERLTEEDRRQRSIQTIGAFGSPDDGFQITNPSIQGGMPTFDIGKGNLYLGGLRLEMQEVESYVLQGDWLQQSASDAIPLPPPGTRFDLVYVEAWSQPVSAVEDSELLEVALGGPDTSARIRTMRRIHVVPGFSVSDCQQAWNSVLASLKERGTINNDSELVSDVQLKVEFDPGGISNDLCSPQTPSGYLGAENQAIRVQLLDANHLTWGFDNAGPLYRVQVSMDKTGQRRVITMLTEPKDQAHSPLSGQVAEVLPWSAVLPNGEKLSESSGLLVRVDSSYNPDTQQFSINIPVPIGFGEDWKNRPDHLSLAPKPEDEFFFLRIWNRGSDTTAPASIPFTADAPISLGHTGIRIIISGSQRPRNTFWIIGARPDSPNRVHPWQLENGLAPHGVHTYVAPLAVILWTDTGGKISGDVVHDCRQKFRPLTDLLDCCVTVEPNDDLHQALSKVKKAGGGCICLQPGDYELKEALDFRGASHITIKGHGTGSRLRVDTNFFGQSMFILDNSKNLTFSSFAIQNQHGSPVWVCRDTQGLTIENMFVYTAYGRNLQAVIEIQESACNKWKVRNNVFLGSKGMAGFRLMQSIILENLWLGTERGIELQNLAELQIERNHFIGISQDTAQGIDGTFLKVLAHTTPSLLASRLGPNVRDRITLFESVIQNLMNIPLRAVGTQVPSSAYIGIQVSGAFDLEVAHNQFFGRIGVLAQMIKNGKFSGNEFLNTLYGTSLFLVHDFHFSENTIGQKLVRSLKKTSISPQIGLRILGDAVNCKILHNTFLSCRDAIVFESDFKKDKETFGEFGVNIKVNASAVTPISKAVLLASTKKAVFDRYKVLDLGKSPFFRVAKSEHILIQGNMIQASNIGIEWSGIKHILDFRISSNAFNGCQGAGILVEPDDRTFFFKEAEKARVRIVDQNQFDIFGPAIRATVGEVRVEKNDIHILAPLFKFLPWKDVVGFLTAEVYSHEPFRNAVKEKNIPNMRLMVSEVAKKAEKNPGVINSARFVKKIEEDLLVAPNNAAEDTLAVGLNDMKYLPSLGAKDLVVGAANKMLALASTQLDGFVVNLSGKQNRVLENRILSNNSLLDGGVAFHLLSGEMRGNEVEVGRIGLMCNGKVSQSSGDVKIEGNRVRVTGAALGAGKKAATYALAIPTLSPGNFSILDNHFEGSVMVGAEPFSSLGLFSKGVLDLSPVVVTAHALSFDPQAFSGSLKELFKPIKNFIATDIDHKIIPGLLIGSFKIFDFDPHKNRAIIQFSDNRVVRGWAALAPSTAGVYFTAEDLQKEPSNAPYMNVTGNVFDYWTRVVGGSLVIVGNHSQDPIQYRTNGSPEVVANIPASKTF